MPRTPSSSSRSRSKPEGWQAEKSQLMRGRLLDAAERMLVSDGFAQLTTEGIAKAAGVSRGAMTHHFKSRLDLLEAVAQHITQKRAAEVDTLVAELATMTSADSPSLEDMRKTMRMLQRYYSMSSFVALHELLRAARADSTLRRVLKPLEQALDRREAETIRRHFPYWIEIESVREVVTDLAHFSLQGVALSPVPYIGTERLEHLLDLLASVALQQFSNAIVTRETAAVTRRRSGAKSR